MNEDLEQLEALLKDPRHEREWIRQNNLLTPPDAEWPIDSRLKHIDTR